VPTGLSGDSSVQHRIARDRLAKRLFHGVVIHLSGETDADDEGHRIRRPIVCEQKPFERRQRHRK
jgi:hypothetical protein